MKTVFTITITSIISIAIKAILALFPSGVKAMADKGW